MSDRGKSQSESDVTQTGAGAGTTGAGAQAGQTDVGSGSVTRGAGVEAGYASAGADTQSDIGQAEAYALNLKRLVANELDYDQDSRDLRSRQKRNAEDHDQGFRELTLQHFQNAVESHDQAAQQGLSFRASLQAQTIAERERTVRAGDLATDRMWNIDEVSLGALSATIAVAVAQALSGDDG